MTTRRRPIRLAAFLALVPFLAQAADGPLRNVDWSGFHFGVQAGYVGGRLGREGYDSQFFALNGPRAPDADGVVGGVRGGYDARIGKGFVAGIMGEASGSGASGRTATGGSVGFDRFAIVSGRVGYAFESVLVYGTAGGALGGIRFAPAAGAETGRTAGGWAAGGGVEYAISRHLSVGVNYRYLNFERAVPAGPGMDPRGNADAQTLQGSVSYRW